jgi:hemin uptake protein HemP
MEAEPISKKNGGGRADDRGAPLAQRTIESRELLGERGELIIVHAGREYRLRLTQNGKLILTA